MKIEDVKVGMRVKTSCGEGVVNRIVREFVMVTIDGTDLGFHHANITPMPTNRDYDDLVKIGKERGYRDPDRWARDVIKGLVMGGSPDNYATLSAILTEALTRASEGKGKDRHANGKQFDEQPIVSLNLTLSSQDGPLFQIQKKCSEASRFYASGERERAENELLDCIVYAAGAVITGRRRE